MTNLAQQLFTTADKFPQQVAIRLDDVELTWTQLRDKAAGLATALRAAGLQPGDRVVLMLPNVPAFPVLFYGTLMAGGIVVPMNPLLKEREIKFYFSNSGAKFCFVWPDFAGEANQAAAGSEVRVITCTVDGPEAGALEVGSR